MKGSIISIMLGWFVLTTNCYGAAIMFDDTYYEVDVGPNLPHPPATLTVHVRFVVLRVIPSR